jgi:MoaA/NifB/PqqE/SkfB family radical SAM enzyme
MERLELHLTYTCAERCIFCSEQQRMKQFSRFPVTWGRVAKVLRMHASRGVRGVHFTGGEPSIHPRFIDALRLARKLGMRTSMGTIGTMLSRPDFAQKVMPHLDEALFSIHGPDAATHDALTRRAGSFERVTAAMKLSKELNPDFSAFVNTVLTRDNLEALPDTVALSADLGAELVVISNTTPEGGGYEAYETLAVPLRDLQRVLARVPERAGNAIVRVFGVPMCILGEHHMLSNDLHWDPRVTVEWQSAPGKVVFGGLYSWAPDRKRVHAPECDGCSWKTVCSGVFDRYAELWPTDALKPQTSLTPRAPA